MKYRLMPILIAAMATSCSNTHKDQPKKYEPETLKFNIYLKKTFDKELPHDTCTFVIMSSNGCYGCLNAFFYNLNGSLSGPDLKCIISRKTFFRYKLDTLNLSPNIYIDTTNMVDRLPYHKGNIAIIKIANRKIFSLFNVEPYQTDSVLAEISKLN